MEVVAGSLAGAAYGCNRLALGNSFARSNEYAGRVGIERLRAVVMLNNNIVAVAAVPRTVVAGGKHNASG